MDRHWRPPRSRPLLCLLALCRRPFECARRCRSLLGIIGTSLTAVITPLLAEISHAVDAIAHQHPSICGPSGTYAQAYSLFSMTLSASLLVGPLWAGFMLDAAGWNAVGWSLGILCFVSAVPAVVSISGREKTLDNRDPFLINIP